MKISPKRKLYIKKITSNISFDINLSNTKPLSQDRKNYIKKITSEALSSLDLN